MCPEVFEMKDDGKADVVDLEKDKCGYEMAIESCPVDAIKIIR